jgi:uncharacterized protein (DUF58 family)
MNQLAYLIIFLLVVAFFLRIDFIFYIVYVCLGIYVWSVWQAPRALAQLRLSRTFAERAFLNERVAVNLTIQNQQRLPLPWLQLMESMPPELRAGDAVDRVLTLHGRESTTITYHVKATRRGYYRLGPLQLTSGDLFGFSERHARLPANFLTVYPRLIPMAQLGLPSRLPFGTVASHQRLFEDPARPQGVREYRSGDSLRQINWKVSAHSNSLVVKTFQPAISLETAVLLNLNSHDYSPRQRYETAEWAIEVAASLAAHLAGQRQAVGLISNGADPLRQIEGYGARGLFDEVSGRLLLAPGRDNPPADAPAELGRAAAYIPAPIPPRPGRAHLMKVLELLARLETADTLAYGRWAPAACLSLSWGVTVLALTPVADLATCQMLHRLVRAGLNPVLIVVQATANMGQLRERARRLGFMAYQVARPQELGALTQSAP